MMKSFGSQNDINASSRTSFLHDCINIAIMGIELRNMGDSAGMTQRCAKHYKRMTSYLKQVLHKLVTDKKVTFLLSLSS